MARAAAPPRNFARPPSAGRRTAVRPAAVGDDRHVRVVGVVAPRPARSTSGPSSSGTTLKITREECYAGWDDAVQHAVLVDDRVGAAVRPRRARRARLPDRSRRTPAASSARSISKRYQDSSQATTTVTMLPSVSDGRTLDERRAERARDARDRARMLAGVEELDRARDLHVGVRRDRVDEPVLAVDRRLGGSRLGDRRRRRLGREVRRRHRVGVRPRSPRRGSRRPRARAARRPRRARRWRRRSRKPAPPPRDQPRARGRARRRRPRGSSPRARRAACTARRPAALAAVQEDVGALAAQQRAPADGARRRSRAGSRSGAESQAARVAAGGSRHGPVTGG